MKFVHCKSGLTGKDLFKEVVDTLNELGLDLKNCRGQGYDGAGAVSGVVNGLSALILKENEKARYTHCANHRLNLAISTSCKITSIRNLMNTIKEITYFFNFSPIWSEHLQRIIKNASQNKGKTKLFDVCRTRWVIRIEGLDVFEDILIYIVQTFEYFCLSADSSVNRDTVAKAQVLLNHVTNLNFIVTLVVTRKAFDYTHSVAELLQAKSNDIVKGFDLIGSLIDLFVNVRHDIDNYHEKWYKEALELAKILNIVEVVPRVCSKQMLRENYPSNSSSEYYKLSLTIPLVDTVLGELKRRFEDNQTYVFSGFYGIPYVMVASLKSPTKETWRDHFKRFLRFYENGFEDLCLLSLDGELSLWEHHWKNSVKGLPDNVSSTLK